MWFDQMDAGRERNSTGKKNNEGAFLDIDFEYDNIFTKCLATALAPKGIQALWYVAFRGSTVICR
jgi:hypothetical protein